MNTNRAFWRALHSLAHPVSIIAIILVILNDHIFRIYWPSWWTGKIGDVAWIVFIPFIVAVVIALLVPTSWKKQEAFVGWLSFAIVILGFTWVKTTGVGRAAAIWTLESINGWDTNVVKDPTDLFALAALFASWLVWDRAKNHEPSLSPKVWLIVALGIFATLATGSAPRPFNDYGVTCILEQHDSTYLNGVALVTYTSIGYNGATKYISTNGGLYWQKVSPSFYVTLENVPDCPLETLIVHPDLPKTKYSIAPGESISRSDDNGVTWEIVNELWEIKQEVREFYHNRHNETNISGRQVKRSVGPLMGIIDGQTGNVVFAMGWDGVLVHKVDGEWQWASVSELYQLSNLQRLDTIPTILRGEYLLATILALLMIGTCGVLLGLQNQNTILISIGWLFWLLTIICPAFSDHIQEESGILIVLGFISVFVAAGIALLAAFAALNQAFHKNNRFSIIPILSLSILTALVFLMPYLLWSQGTIPRYTTALLYSFALAAAGLFTTSKYLDRLQITDIEITEDSFYELHSKPKK